jgi:glutamate carboxypeptidase
MLFPLTRIQNYLLQNQSRYIEILKKMVMINSHSYHRAGVNALGEYTEEVFQSLEFSCTKVETFSGGRHILLVRNLDNNKAANSSCKTVVLVSHLDTVYTENEEREAHFVWRTEGEKLYGPGTCDIKGGTVCIYITLEILKNFSPQLFDAHRWIVALDALEETDSEGFFEAVKTVLKGESATACLVYEGGSSEKQEDGSVVQKLVVARRSRGIYTIVVKGKASHAGSGHKQGVNAITLLAKIVQEASLLTDYEKDVTINVGIIAGGGTVNTVPYEARATLEIRAFDSIVYNETVEKLKALCAAATLKSYEGNFQSTVILEAGLAMPPWAPNPATQKLFEIWEEAGKKLDMKIAAEKRGGGSDGNRLVSLIPSVLDGLGPVGGNIHCSKRDPEKGIDQEFIYKDSLHEKALLNALALYTMLSS